MEAVLDIAVVATGSVIVAGYIWSTRHHFHTDKVPGGVVVISVVVILTWLAYSALVLTRRQPVELLAIGYVFQLVSASLFWWAVATTRTAQLRYIFDPKEPQGLVTEGPYRFIRHPFYTSYIIFWCGWAIALGSIWACLPAVFLAAIYVSAARNEELAFLRSPLESRYRAYAKTTGFLLPTAFGRRAGAVSQA